MFSVRADRAATLYIFDALARFQPRKKRIPILMYHGIREADISRQHPYFQTSTTAGIFEEQVRFLHGNGYRSVNVTDLRETEPAERLVSFTFDDGYRDFYTNAFPILNKYGFSATVFLPTAYIGENPGHFNGSRCLTWSEVRELHKAGIEFGSHTVTHPQLRCVSNEQMRVELARSRDDIQENLGDSVYAFAYPYAFPETDPTFVDCVGRALRENGYKTGVTTVIGRATPSQNPFFMRRLPVNSHDDLRLFRSKVEGGYDWLRTVQYLSKLKAARRSTHRHPGAVK